MTPSEPRAPAPAERERIDWSQIWLPGPTRVFTAHERQLAGGQPPGRSLVVAALINYALLAYLMLLLAPPVATAALTAVLAAGGVIGWWGTRRIWRRPERGYLGRLTFLCTTGFVVCGALLPRLGGWERGTPQAQWTLGAAGMLALLVSVLWWFVAVYRAHQIESRLREQAEQQRALAMTRQLAAAQIQPHFLFNSLASLQHWVQAKDDRAGPMLDALTGFLRATLPLFNRDRLALGDELAAARQYLAVMQLRLGERLQVEVDASPAAAALPVPPGLLLTLVENAVEHGVMPSLSATRIRVAAGIDGDQAWLTVQDDGPGLSPTHDVAGGDGVGLTNVRWRLAQAFGHSAKLTLTTPTNGGCEARLTWPAPADVAGPGGAMPAAHFP